MPLDQLPETSTRDDDRVTVLRAEFVADERACYLGLYTGAHCELPTGEVVEVRHRRTPLFCLCRVLDRRGYGSYQIQIFTLQGTPSLAGRVATLAGLTITERDKDGLRLEKYRPFPPRGRAQERDLTIA